MSDLDVMPAEREVDEADLTQPEQAEAVEQTEVEAQDADTDEEAAPSEDAEPEKPKRRSRAEERIHALTREKYEAQQRAEQYERQMREMQQYFAQQQQQRPMSEPPKLADYDYDENAYSQAIQQWHVGQVQEMQRQQQIQQQQYAMQQQQMQRQQALMQKAQEATAKYPDWQAKVSDPNLPPLAQINPAAFEAVASSDAFADVTYYLANNPQEVFSFHGLDPVSAIRKVAQIEARLSAKPVASQKAPPKPPSRVKGNSEAVSDPSKMSTDEWMEWRNRQLHQR